MSQKRKDNRSEADKHKKSKTADDIEEINDPFSEDEHLTQSNWARPPAPHINPETDTIVFQQLQVDYTLGETPNNIPGITPPAGKAPIIRMYGVTAEGNSILGKIYGVIPYFYIPAPPNFAENDCNRFRDELNKRMELSSNDKMGNFPKYILGVEIVKKSSILGYRKNKNSNFLKISTASPKHVPTCRTILETDFMGQSYTTYESNIQFVLRYMIDRNIVGANWVEIPPKKYTVCRNPISTCQIEIDFAFDAIISHAPDGEWSKIAPLRILSFDIECAGRKGVFPEPDHDPIIQIANLVTIQGQKKPFARNVFTLKTCSSIVGAQILSFQKEGEMLVEWKKFIQKVDPDIITGYNINNFDLWYLLSRARKLQVPEFLFLGRVRDTASRMKDTTFSSKAYGTRESKTITMDGRITFDVLQLMQREFKLRSYSLNSVSAEFLGQQKEDVHHSIITDLFNGTDDDRRRLAVYCLKDAYLPQQLLEKLMCLINYIEMARVTGVPFDYLLSRGQQIKVVSQLYRKAKEEGLLIPNVTAKATDEKYEGAIVIEPKKGYYDQPIPTLDFSSLYPSIMISHNLCYSTLIHQSEVHKYSPDEYEKTPSGDHFVRVGVYKGILPCILEELLAARAKAKLDLKKETDPFKKAVLDGRQLALKVSANSVYGFTGATVGKLPCLEISSSVTAYGRQMIEMTKKLVEEKYTIKNGYSHDAVVVYGDTDSVMVKFGSLDIETAMKMGKEAAAEVTKHFPKPIKLEFEKVYYPYLLINKKRYAGLLWTKPDKFDKMDCKGIESVRRDNCPLVKNVINTCLKKILIDRNIEGAISYTKSIISDLLCNKLDLSLLVITKALSKSGDEYSAKQAHVELAERMRKRDPGTAPVIGDRVPYVIIRSSKGAKAYEKSEDPLWVLEKNIPLDTQYYLDQQLAGPLTRLFEPIMGDPASLFSGDHTRTISLSTPSVGGIVQFAVKTLTCMGCRSPLPKGEKTLCAYCKKREFEIYYSKLGKVNNLEQQFASVWTECQRCQGSLHKTVLCTSRDCPIFYMRKKIQKDLKDAIDTLDRFQISW
eukprot:TRINITY_DN8274_c0_g2_i1.p1 TRINITY_DN8274_c0_g2~~TRINITY_DN8274_c0_g2_i1.p1  ORF type:complete len:1057 (+),score=317.15 TRINITY_DN8274_c0_g2_i1:150-3320(+)